MFNILNVNKMALKFNIVSFRGTIFTSRIPYNNENLLAILSDFKGYTPSNIPNMPGLATPNVGGGAFMPVPNIGTWQIMSPDNRITIMFLEQKIDVIVNSGQKEYSQDAITTLAKECYNLFEKLSQRFGFSISRLALAPNLVHVVTNPKELHNFAINTFGEVKFKGNLIDNATFSKVYRHNEKILDNDYTINYLLNVHNGSFIANYDNKLELKDTIVADFDINTYVNPQYVFDTKAMSDFFEKAPMWLQDYFLFNFANGQ